MYVFLSLALGCATLTLLFLSSSGYIRSRETPGTGIFAWLCLCCAFYTGGYTGEILSPDIKTLLLFTRIQYLGLSFIPACIILMAMEFDGRWSRRKTRYLVLLPSAITLLLVLFIDRHELFYVSPGMKVINGLSILSTSRGFWYFVQQMFMYLSFGFGIVVFMINIRYGSHAKKVQARYLLAGGLLPLLGNILYLYIGTPSGLDLAPISLAGTAILFSMGFLRHRAFDLAPLARDAVFDQMRDAIVVVDEKERLIDFNRVAKAILPALEDKAAILGVHIDTVLAGYPEIAEVISTNRPRDVIVPLPDGSSGFFETRFSGLEDNRGRKRGTVLTLVDVTERAALESRLKELAQTDDLTGLLNRRHFMEMARTELDRARRYGRPFGVAIMDLNSFKHINDTWGHAAGDSALRLVSRLCKDSLRACDLMSRYGGDEFAFAFPECDADEASAAGEKLARVVSAATLTLGSQVVVLSASIGTAGNTGSTYPELEDMLATADGTMYRKKKAGHRVS